VNSKTAKQLRRAAGYRNQTATPGLMDFPGVARMVKHPRFERRETVKTSYEFLPGLEKPVKVDTPVSRLVLGPRRQPIPVVETNPDFGKPIHGLPGVIDAQEIRQAFDLVPTTKPARLRPTEPKGVYRALKRLARRGLLDAAAKVEEFVDQINGTEEVRT
jgi:hypothetical protein